MATRYINVRQTAGRTTYDSAINNILLQFYEYVNN